MIGFIWILCLAQISFAQYDSVRQKDEGDDVLLPLRPLTGHVVQRNAPLLNGFIIVGNDEQHLPNGHPLIGQLEAPGPQSGSPPGSAAPPGASSASPPDQTSRPRRTRKPTTQIVPSTQGTVETQTDASTAALPDNSTVVLPSDASGPTAETEGVTPEPDVATTESEANYYVVRSCTVVQCNSVSVCKVIDNEAKCIPTVGEKRGQCPVKGESSKPQDDTTCAKPCVDDQGCTDDLKCCTIGCGKSCHKPRPNNPCEPKPCPKGQRCEPEIKSCLESPCPQYRCVSATKPPPS